MTKLNRLHGFAVLVTRPQSQAERLCQKIKAQGGVAIRFPLLEIKENSVTAEIKQRLDSYQKFIFISSNAVEYAFRMWPDCFPTLSKAAVFAVGESTAATLREKGIIAYVSHEKRASSEKLLQHEKLQADEIKNNKILIVKGVDGRELLTETLRNRGAKIGHAEVYIRQKPCYHSKQIEQIWDNNSNFIIILTSNEATENIISIMCPDFTEQLFNCDIVTISKRVADHANLYNFKQPIYIASETSDNGLIQAMLQIAKER